MTNEMKEKLLELEKGYIKTRQPVDILFFFEDYVEIYIEQEHIDKEVIEYVRNNSNRIEKLYNEYHK